MKRIFYNACSVLILFSFMTFQSCKEDETAPTITIIGSADTIIAKGSVYIDPGATAEDDKDETVYVVSDFTTTNPDETVTQEYTITYKAQDRNANMATATRKVNVTWVGSTVAFTYNVTDTCLNNMSLNTTYQSNVTSDFIDPFKVYVSNLQNSFSGSTTVYLKGNSITIPSQKPDGGLSPFTVSGTGNIIDSPPNIIWDVHYTVTDDTGGPTLYRHAVFVY